VKSVGVFALFLLISASAWAEYRVFLLKITKAPAASGQPEQIRYVESTLDPEQYPRYYTVYPDETVSYEETWRCFGNTSYNKPFCPNPTIDRRAPASGQISSPETPIN
jgi:hypothetical protein